MVAIVANNRNFTRGGVVRNPVHYSSGQTLRSFAFCAANISYAAPAPLERHGVVKRGLVRDHGLRRDVVRLRGLRDVRALDAEDL